MKIYDVDELVGKSFNYIINNYSNFSIFRKVGSDSSSCLFISVMLHGNEPCGLNAIIKELERRDISYNKDVYFMIGNVEAARVGKRLIEENFNRIWSFKPESKLEFIANKIFVFLKNVNVVGVLDIHSFDSEKIKPHCFISNIDNQTLLISKKLSELTFINKGDENLLIDMTRDLCSSFIVEAGTNNSKNADNYAYDVLKKFFKIFDVEDNNHDLVDISKGIYSSEVNFKFNTDKISFEENNNDNLINIREDIEELNLTPIKKGEFFADFNSVSFLNSDKQIGDYFFVQNNKIYFKKNCIMNLFTKNVESLKESGFYLYEVFKDDCFKLKKFF